MKLDMSGLERVRTRMQKLSGTHEYALSEILPDKFVKTHTKYPTLQELAGGVNEPSDVSSEAFSQFIADNSDFSSYTEMLQTGYAEFAKRKLAS